MAEFDPNTASVEDVLKKLDKADEAERQRILRAEQGGKSRKTILEPYGIDPDARVDAAGRVLYPWEVDPEDAVVMVEPEEDDEARAAREAQAKFDEQVAAAAPGVDEQGGGTAAGVGVAATGVAGATGPTGTGTGGTTTGGV